ncbi:MAG: biopolymer transporter ExbD [Phycisphaeraceae bacterium]|nr:biopolymer transporter ExbD [Phycisphaeraceae bacterium]
MRFNRNKEMPEAGFDITSMIDVVLLLTIFFMMSSQFSRIAQRDLDLPRQPGDAHPRPDSAADAAVVIDLEKDGRLSVAGRNYPLERLTTMVAIDRQRAERTGNFLDVIIRADRSTPAPQLQKLAGALSAEGVDSWRLATTGEAHRSRGASSLESGGGSKP